MSHSRGQSCIDELNVGLRPINARAKTAKLTTDLLSWARPQDSIKNEEGDEKARPLINHLYECRIIPTRDVFVEWRGVWEFSLIALCHYREEGSLWWSIYPDGIVVG